MADAAGSINEVQRRTQAIEGIEHTLAGAAPHSTAEAGALAKMQQELTAENTNKGTSGDTSAQVVKQLQADGFSNVTLDKSGNLIFSPSDQTSAQTSPPDAKATGADGADKTAPPGEAQAATGAARAPEQADFIRFAQMLTQVQSGQKVDASEFASVFGTQDAAILQSMGLQSIANANGHFNVAFANNGSIPFGSDTLDYQKTTSFDLSTTSNGIQLSNINGLKGKEGSLNPTVTKVLIAPEDAQTKEWNVDVTGKELFVSADTKLEVADDTPPGVT